LAKKAPDKMTPDETPDFLCKSFRCLVNNSRDGNILVDQAWKVRYLNPAFAELFDTSVSELIDHKLDQFLTPDCVTSLHQKLEQARPDQFFQFKLEITSRSGQKKKIQVTVLPVVEQTGQKIGFSASFSGTSSQLNALEIQKTYFENLFHSSPDAIAILDTEDHVLEINKSFETLFGYTSAEATGQYINDLVVPKHLKQEGLKSTQDVAAGKSIQMETVRQTKDGRTIDVSIVGEPIMLGKNQLAVYGIYRDISQRKLAERRLNILYEISETLSSAESLEQCFRSVHQALGKVMDVSNFYIALVDEDRQELYFPYFQDEISNDYSKSPIKLDNPYSLTTDIIRNKKPLLLYGPELKKRYASGQYKIWGKAPKCWLGVPLILKGKAIGAIALQNYQKPDIYNEKDLTMLKSTAGKIAVVIDRKKAETALKESEEKYRLMVENSRDAIVISQNDRFIFFNQAFAKMLGYEYDELMNKNYKDIYTSKGVQILKGRERRRNVGEEVPSRYETTFRKKDGAVIDVEANVQIIDYHHDKATFAVIRDITEQKQILNTLQESLEKTKRLGDFIPICASCKKIRDEEKEGEPWVTPEEYITERLPNTNFSHGICPECMEKYYPDFAKKKNQKK